MERIERRTIAFDRARAKDESRTIEASISSEAPVDRGWGNEVLRHDKESIDLSRAPFPILVNHKSEETPVGVAENIRLEGGRLVATFRFGKNSRASEIWEDIKDGILRNVSVSYRIKDIIEQGRDIVVSSWELLEVSVVSIPADHTVGIGRKFNFNQKGYSRMEREQNREHEGGEVRVNESSERRRTSQIVSVGQAFGDRIDNMNSLVSRAIDGGWSVDDFQKAIMKRMSSSCTPPDLPSPPDCIEQRQVLGLSQREIEGYSVIRAINAAATNDWSNAGFEREVSMEASRGIGRRNSGLVIPFEVFQQRGLVKGTASAGGDMIGTDHLAGDFIEMLRAKARVMEMGAKTMFGLVGDVEIPKQTGSATAYWVGENADITESDQSFDKVSLTPKTLGALTNISRKMLLQSSPDAEDIVRADLSALLALQIDKVAIMGDGLSNKPVGILNTTGIGAAVCGDPDGGEPDWSHILTLISELAVDNAERGRLGFLTNPKVRAKLMRTDKGTDTGAYVWEPGRDGGGTMAGLRAAVSNNVPSDLTKNGGSNLSAIIYGNWEDLLVGFWGAGIELQVDPYGSNFAKGSVSIRAMVDCDIAVRNHESFAAIQDAVTS